MKNFSRKLALIFGLIIFLFLQQPYGQENPNYVNLSYIVKEVKSASRNKKKNEKITAKLIKEIQERKVNFIMTEENKAFITKIGGNELLIKAIQENVSQGLLESEKYFEERETLYQRFRNNRKGPSLENYKIALEAAKEYVEKYENSLCDLIIPYIKNQIPKLEEKIKSLQNQ